MNNNYVQIIEPESTFNTPALCRYDLKKKYPSKPLSFDYCLLRLVQNDGDYAVVKKTYNQMGSQSHTTSEIFTCFPDAKKTMDDFLNQYLEKGYRLINKESSADDTLYQLETNYIYPTMEELQKFAQDPDIVLEALPNINDWKVFYFNSEVVIYSSLDNFTTAPTIDTPFLLYKDIGIQYKDTFPLLKTIFIGMLTHDNKIRVFDIISLGHDKNNNSILTAKYEWKQRRMMMTNLFTELYGPHADIYNSMLPVYLTPYRSQPDAKEALIRKTPTHRNLHVRNINSYFQDPITIVGRV